MVVAQEKFSKEKRALLAGDLNLIDYQKRELANQMDIVRQELHLAKMVRRKCQRFDKQRIAVVRSRP